MRGVTTSPIRPVASVRISTHTPHARRDGYDIRIVDFIPKFQLTRLMRGVTVAFRLFHHFPMISTHTPHARRDACTPFRMRPVS